MLVPIGGGKDSVVALEIVRRSGCELALFSVGDAPPIARTVAVAGLPHLLVRRTLDPGLPALNEAGALNGHVPITAIVSCVALLTAALRGFDAVAMANERSASAGNLSWDGVEVNHQFSKGLRAERLLSAAVAEVSPAACGCSRSCARRRSWRSRARSRGWSATTARSPAATRSSASIPRCAPRRGAATAPSAGSCSWRSRPSASPEHLRVLFGRDLLEDEHQFEGFALLTATGGHKPFECVGEEQESLAAIRLLANDPRWSEHRVLRRLVAEVLPRYPPYVGDPDQVLALSDEHAVPAALLADVRALLGA